MRQDPTAGINKEVCTQEQGHLGVTIQQETLSQSFNIPNALPKKKNNPSLKS